MFFSIVYEDMREAARRYGFIDGIAELERICK